MLKQEGAKREGAKENKKYVQTVKCREHYSGKGQEERGEGEKLSTVYKVF